MAAQFSRKRTVGKTTATGQKEKAPRIDKLVEMLNPKPNKWYGIRLVGPNFSYAYHWFEVEVTGGKQPTARFPKQCLSYSDADETCDSTINCPYHAIDPKANPGVHYYQNVLVREIQERQPKDLGVTKDEAKSGFKELASDSWTPMRVLQLPPTAIENLRNIGELNKHGKKGAKVAYDLGDEEFGCDLMYMFDPDATGGDKHKFQKGEHTPLEPEELEYLLWNIEDLVTPESEKVAQAEADSLVDRMIVRDKDGNIIDYTPPGGSKKAAKYDGDAGEEDYSPDVGEDVVLVDGDDNTFKGTVTAVNEISITIEDADEEVHKFKWKDLESCNPAPAKGKGKKPAAKDDDDDAPPPGKKKPAAAKDDDDDAPEFKAGDKVVVTDDDDDEFTGTITVITAKSVTIEDAQEIEHKFKISDVKIKAAPAKGKKPAAKDEGDDEPEFKVGDKVVVTDEDDEAVTGTITAISAKSITIEDADEDDHKYKISDVKIKPARGKPKPAAKDEDDTPEFKVGDKVTVTDEDGDVTGTITVLTAKSITIEDDDEDDHKYKLEDVKVKVAKSKPKKPAAKDDDDDATPAKGKKKRPSFEDD